MFLIDDLLHAWRGLKSSPGFLALAATVLAVGLGATIFAYGIINTLILKPPPLPQADQLYAVSSAVPAREQQFNMLSYVDYLDIKREQRSFQDLAAYYNGTVILSGDDPPERYTGGMVSWNFMRVLGVKPLLGRDFTPDDDLPSATSVALLSYDLWQTRFHGDPEIVGRVIGMNARPTTIIGVMPKGFSYPSREVLWTPMARDAAPERRGDESFEDFVGVYAIGRLAPGVTAQQAADDLASIAARLAILHPATNAGRTTHVVPAAMSLVGDGKSILYAMFAAVLLLLLMACANVSSLIFVRASSRMYEAGLRAALGATRPRLILQMLAESFIISLIGVAGGIALAAVALHLMHRAMDSLVEHDVPPWWTFSIDPGVALFAAGAAVVAALLSGIFPALRASRPNVMGILRDGGRTGTGMRLNKFTTAMVIVELALAATLLTGAALMTRASFISLQPDFGVDVSGFMSARVGLPRAKYPPEAQSAFFQKAVDLLRERPGVLAALATTSVPGTGAEDWHFTIEGESYTDRSEYPYAHGVAVTPGSFAAYGRPILAGRDFNDADTADSPSVVLVNEALVRRYFGGENPVGRRVYSPDQESLNPITIVGVVPNINHAMDWDDGDFPPTVYRPVSQQPWRFMTLAIRTEGDPHAYGKVIRDVVRQIDPDLAPYWVKTLSEFQDQKRSALRLHANVFAGFALIAFMMAAVGIYGVLAFATGQRNREIGVRRALGAHDRQILATIMRTTAFQLAVGLTLGALFAPIMARGISRGLFGMPPDDPVIYSLVFSSLILAAMLASWIPARRALRIEPAAALRRE